MGVPSTCTIVGGKNNKDSSRLEEDAGLGALYCTEYNITKEESPKNAIKSIHSLSSVVNKYKTPVAGA